MTINKKVAIVLISLMILSIFSGFVAAGKDSKHCKPKKGNCSLPIQADGSDVPSQAVADKSREFSLGQLASCKDVKLRRGDEASFSSNGYDYIMRPGLVGSRYIQLSLNPGSFNSRMYPMDNMLYDLDVNGRYDLEITLTQISNGKAYLNVCQLEDAQQGKDAVLSLQADNAGELTGKVVKQQFNGKPVFSWINGIILAIAGILSLHL